MKKQILFLLILLCLGVTLFAQPKTYKLISKTDSSDINQQAILLIDTANTIGARHNAFNPIKGNYIVFLFTATYRGLSFTNKEKDFHDILVIKTDKAQRVLEAYQYTLEWAEMPLTQDLYQSSTKGVRLTNGLAIEKLKFRKVDSQEGINNELREPGLLVF